MNKRAPLNAWIGYKILQVFQFERLKVWKYSLFFLLCTCSVYAHYVKNFFLDFIDSSRTGTEMAQ